MKNKIIYLGLVILSILYLLEVDFSSLTYINYAAFLIIGVTLVSMFINIYSSTRERNKEKEAKRLVKEAKKIEKEDKK